MSERAGSVVVDHELKCWPVFFESIVEGWKTFDLRKDDRGGFHVGQRIRLREWEPTGGGYTGRCIEVTVTYVTHGGWGLLPGYVCMGIAGPLDARRQLAAHGWPSAGSTPTAASTDRSRSSCARPRSVRSTCTRAVSPPAGRRKEPMMNPDTREFEPVTDNTPNEWARFTIGEEVLLRHWWWKIIADQGAAVLACSGRYLTLEAVRPEKAAVDAGAVGGAQDAGAAPSR